MVSEIRVFQSRKLYCKNVNNWCVPQFLPTNNVQSKLNCKYKFNLNSLFFENIITPLNQRGIFLITSVIKHLFVNNYSRPRISRSQCTPN